MARTVPRALRSVAEDYAEAARAHASLGRILPAVAAAAEAVTGTLRRGGKVLLCGNGGSAADAQHFAGELLGKFLVQRRALPVVALTTDTSTLTAIGNDLGFERVFARQVEGLGRRGDLLVAISTSGRSPNVLAACRQARRMGIRVLALTGAAPGPLLRLADLAIRAPSRSTPRIQECHGFAIHAICRAAEAALAGGARR